MAIRPALVSLMFSLMLPLALLVSTVPAAAQHGGSTPGSHAAPSEASQFDFLVGQWEVVAEPYVAGLAALIHGAPRLPGTWKAWRGLGGWGIEDEIQLTDPSGNPQVLTHCVRVYDVKLRHWNLSFVDVYSSALRSATAEWRDGEMHISGGGSDPDGRVYVSRSRFKDITPASFRLQQDRSYDGGRTWTDGFLKIEAKRVAATAPR